MFRLFSREKTKTTAEIRISDASEFIELKAEKELAEMRRKLDTLIPDIFEDINKLRNLFESLSKEKPDDAYSNNIKDRYCEKCTALFNFEIPKISEMNYSKLVKFADNLDKINASSTNLTIKEFKHMRFFKDKMGKISLQTKVIERKTKNLRDNIKNSILEKKEKMEKCIAWINELNQKINAINNEIYSIENEKKYATEESSEIASKLSSLESNGTQERFSKTMEEKEAIEKHMDFIKQKIETEFGGLLRPLKRLQYASVSGEVALLKTEKGILEQYLQNMDAFLEHDTELIIRNLVAQIKKLSDNNVIELNEKEKAKVLDIYGNMKFLINLKSQYNDLLIQLQEKENKIKSTYMPFTEKRASAQNELEKKKEEIQRLENKIREKNEEIANQKKKIESNIFILENMIRDFINIEAKIIY